MRAGYQPGGGEYRGDPDFPMRAGSYPVCSDPVSANLSARLARRAFGVASIRRRINSASHQFGVASIRRCVNSASHQFGVA